MKKIILFIMFAAISSDFLGSAHNQHRSDSYDNKKLDDLDSAARLLVCCCILAGCLTPQKKPLFDDLKNKQTDMPERKKMMNIKENQS